MSSKNKQRKPKYTLELKQDAAKSSLNNNSAGLSRSISLNNCSSDLTSYNTK